VVVAFSTAAGSGRLLSIFMAAPGPIYAVGHIH
jgi:hypothetical protein